MKYYVSPAFVEEKQIELPIWLPRDQGPYGGYGQVSNARAVAAGPASVDHLIGMIQRQRRLTHGAGEGRDLIDRLAPNAQGGDGGGDLGRGRLAAQAGGEKVVRLLGRQGMALDQSGEDRLEPVAHGQAATRRFTPAISRKLASMS